MTMIHCYDGQGNEVAVPSEAVVFRPAAYGILIENEQVLLTRQSDTGLWQPPGTILETQETPTQALKQYFRRVAGLSPIIGPLIFVEDLYRITEGGQAWHLSVLYYALDRPPYSSLTLVKKEQVQAEWLPLARLERSLLQFGYDALQAARLRLRL
jgi:8-oxo-dGTP diphosphatase